MSSTKRGRSLAEVMSPIEDEPGTTAESASAVVAKASAVSAADARTSAADNEGSGAVGGGVGAGGSLAGAPAVPAPLRPDGRADLAALGDGRRRGRWPAWRSGRRLGNGVKRRLARRNLREAA